MLKPRGKRTDQYGEVRGNADFALVGRLLAWLVGLAPALLFLLTWAQEPTPLQEIAVSYALPVIAAEVAFVLISLHEGIRFRPPYTPLALLIALALLAWTTAAMAPSNWTALLRTAAWTIHLLFGLAVVNLWHHRMLDFREHVRAIFTGYLIFLALLVAFVATRDQSAHEPISQWPAVGNIRWFSYYAAPVIGLAALGFLRGNRLALVTATAAFATVFWTGARGGIAAALAGFIACTILFPAFRSRSAWLRFLASGLAGFALSVLLSTVVPIIGQGPESMARYGSAGRVELWLATIDSIRQRPLFGWGEGQTVIFTPQLFGWSFPQPHNIVLQVLHAWGIAGGLLVLALTSLAAPLFLKARDPKAAPFQCAALVLAAYSFIDGALYYSQSLALFTLCFAAAIAAELEERVTNRGATLGEP